MSIGETIRELRQSRNMTQKELAGDCITRNMLSGIENGSALPSLQTLIYIAEKLGVTPAYLLSTDEERFAFKKAAALPGIEQSKKNGDYSLCRDICLGLGGEDPEIREQILECDFMLARDAFNAGELRKAGGLFEDIYRRDQRSEHGFGPLCAAYSACISDISPSLDNDLPAEGDTAAGLSDSFTLYYFFYRMTAEKNLYSQIAENYAGRNPGPENAGLAHIHARLLMQRGRYADAAAVMKITIDNAVDTPLPLMYFMSGDLEICCRESGDYKGAYEFSGLHRDLFERFLR